MWKSHLQNIPVSLDVRRKGLDVHSHQRGVLTASPSPFSSSPQHHHPSSEPRPAFPHREPSPFRFLGLRSMSAVEGPDVERPW
jgi:hypothetical protein